MKIRGPERDMRCRCLHGQRPMGRHHNGVRYVQPVVRLSTAPDCPVHVSHACVGTRRVCDRCGAPRGAWIHPEARTR